MNAVMVSLATPMILLSHLKFDHKPSLAGLVGEFQGVYSQWGLNIRHKGK